MLGRVAPHEGVGGSRHLVEAPHFEEFRPDGGIVRFGLDHSLFLQRGYRRQPVAPLKGHRRRTLVVGLEGPWGLR